MTEVIESMQSYLSDDNDVIDNNEKYSGKKSKQKDTPLDSLEISKKNLNEINDDEDCEIVSLSKLIFNLNKSLKSVWLSEFWI